MKINMQSVMNTIFMNDDTMIKGINLMTSVTMYEVNTKFLNYAEKVEASKREEIARPSFKADYFYQVNSDAITCKSVHGHQMTVNQVVQKAARCLCALNTIAKKNGEAFINEYIDLENTSECVKLIHAFQDAWEEAYNLTYNHFKSWLKAELQGE